MSNLLTLLFKKKRKCNLLKKQANRTFALSLTKNERFARKTLLYLCSNADGLCPLLRILFWKQWRGLAAFWHSSTKSDPVHPNRRPRESFNMTTFYVTETFFQVIYILSLFGYHYIFPNVWYNNSSLLFLA